MAAASPVVRRWTPTPSPTTPLNVASSIGGEHETGRGVFLTWWAVSVTAVDEKGRHKLILDQITGCARPGQVCKGISGGERKRVNICMELLASPGLLFLDEPTSGLDSAAAYHVMAHIARLARTTGTTVVAAVHQPSTEAFDLFNGLCLLANGRMVYFGPS